MSYAPFVKLTKRSLGEKMNQQQDKLLKGTTTLGLVCTDGVVLATEHRATMGTLIAHKNTKKLFKIDDNLGLTIAGLVGDAQVLSRYLSAEVELYKMKKKSNISVKAAATLMANILSGRRYFPYWVALVIGGIDSEGGHVYALDAAGGSIPDKYVTTGSGSPYVYGVLEDHYDESLNVNKGADLAIRALSVAMKRDSASGNGANVGIITEDGFTFLDQDDIAKRMKKMKISY